MQAKPHLLAYLMLPLRVTRLEFRNKVYLGKLECQILARVASMASLTCVRFSVVMLI